MMLPVPTSPCTLATHALSQTPTSLELISVPTALSPTVVAAECRAHPASSEPDSTLPVVASGSSPSKPHFNSGFSHATKSQRTLPTVAPILPAGVHLCSSLIPTMAVMLLATLSIRLWYVLTLSRQVSLQLS